MWWKRLLIGISVTTVCASASLSAGAGKAAAFNPEEIVAVIGEIAEPVATTWRLPAFKNEIGSLLRTQATKLTPVTDERGLADFKSELLSSAPRRPLPDEVVPVHGEVPSPYRQAKGMLCETVVDLLANPDKLSWKYSIDQVNNRIMQAAPLGKKLVLYSELSEIADHFERGCICAATAELMAFFAKKVWCEG
ncbi:MAG: hypothetical protein JO022_14400 [Acidobacteriaceae bacterium]|nr:hypothetical protein [Acidobacteriaceae bacterium]